MNKILLTVGPEGTNGHVAASDYGRNIGVSEFQFTRPHYAIIETVAKNYELYIGLVPFETTPGGLISKVIETMDIYRPKIFGEYVLPVHHCLAWKGRWEDVRLLVSHEEAFKQCSKYLRNHYPMIEKKEVDSTSLAAEMASKDERLAALCTKLATNIYSLPNVIEGIQDSKKNTTRFIAISDKDCENVTGNDRTLLRYEVENKPAALWNAMGVFAKRGFNLSIQNSFPTGDERGEYYQLTEVGAHRLERKMQEALEELQQLVIEGSLYIYGSYPRHKVD